MDTKAIKDCDKDIKNRFNFKWLEKQVEVVVGKEKKIVCVGDDCVKINVPGHGMCKLCSKQINYGSRGCVAFEDHLKTSKHTQLLKERFSSYRYLISTNSYKNLYLYFHI